MAENKENDRRKSVFESLPSYLAGFAAVATATVAVLTYLHTREAAPGAEQETKATTETEINHNHVTAVPGVEIAPARASSGSNGSAAGTAGRGATQAAPSLNSALHPTQCGAYIGRWKLSSGEVMSALENKRVEVKGDGAPRFGRWYCSGSAEELFYLTLDGAQTVIFEASGDGETIYQRADQRNPTPLSATHLGP
jgi:hypothetical protein